MLNECQTNARQKSDRGMAEECWTNSDESPEITDQILGPDLWSISLNWMYVIVVPY